MRGAPGASGSGLRIQKQKDKRTECLKKLTSYLLCSISRNKIPNFIPILFTIMHLYLELLTSRYLVGINRFTFLKLSVQYCFSRVETREEVKYELLFFL